MGDQTMSARIRTRTVGDGTKRYIVLYRRGGRYYPTESLGTFRRLRDAQQRRDLVSGWLAQGVNPKAALAELQKPPATVRTFGEWGELYQASRVDLDERTMKNVNSHLLRLNETFAGTDPFDHTPDDWQQWVAANTDLQPSSLKRYLATGKLVLDYAGVDPNPARDPRVKLPPIRRTEPTPPDANQFLAILEHAPRTRRLALVTIEQTAMTVGELEQLEWQDVDIAESRFRLRRSTVKAQIRSRARWVQVPDWLMDELVAACPPDDRTPIRRVFPGFTPDVAKAVIARACKAAGIPHFHPHDLRHRRISLWHGQGVPARELAARAGHAKASMSLDTYSHVMPLDEAPKVRLAECLVGRPEWP